MTVKLDPYEITVDRQKDGHIFLGNDYLILRALRKVHLCYERAKMHNMIR